MTEREFKRRFPNASRATVEVNCQVRSAEPESDEAQALDGATKGEASCVPRPVVRFTLIHRGAYDSDNLHAAVKDLLDGIRHAHLVIDDSEKHIDLQVTQRKPLPGEEEYTLIEIYYQ